MPSRGHTQLLQVCTASKQLQQALFRLDTLCATPDPGGQAAPQQRIAVVNSFNFCYEACLTACATHLR